MDKRLARSRSDRASVILASKRGYLFLMLEKKKETSVPDEIVVKKWVEQTSDDFRHGFEDIHFDQLFGKDGYPTQPMDLVRFSCEVLCAATKFVKISGALRDVRNVIVMLPFDDTGVRGRRRSWVENDWNRVSQSNTPPNLILMKNEFFTFTVEEYYRRLDLPIDGFPTVRAIFRSWNNTSHHASEFSIGIYLFMQIEGTDSFDPPRKT